MEIPKISKWRFLLAWLLGKKIIGVDIDDGTVTECVAYVWRGNIYVESIE